PEVGLLLFGSMAVETSCLEEGLDVFDKINRPCGGGRKGGHVFAFLLCRGFQGQIGRPDRALIYPGPYEPDLRRGEGVSLAFWRHLHILDQPCDVMNQRTFTAVPHDHIFTTFPLGQSRRARMEAVLTLG